jgi:chromosome segregation ATPase
MEESISALETEKATIEEQIRQLEASIQDLYLGLGHTLNALEYQREKLHEYEQSSIHESVLWLGICGTKQKISHYEEDKQSMTSRINEYGSELNSCKERLKNIEVLIADSTVRDV